MQWSKNRRKSRGDWRPSTKLLNRRPSSQLLCKMSRKMVVHWSSSRWIVLNRCPPSSSASASASASTLLWERWKCSQLLCQMSWKMIILSRGSGWKKRILIVLIRQTNMRNRRQQCRLWHAHGANMMWSAMARRTLQSPLVTFILLCSSPDTAGSVGWSGIPGWNLNVRN